MLWTLTSHTSLSNARIQDHVVPSTTRDVRSESPFEVPDTAARNDPWPRPCVVEWRKIEDEYSGFNGTRQLYFEHGVTR
ncbi:hypothetical protein PtrV1_13553 [Pyrenophora tritici-repentis]|nr:hypothetical protein PtrV1_13553 [Pyrenophora tritici-repentis]